jgi:hypothetical protein
MNPAPKTFKKVTARRHWGALQNFVASLPQEEYSGVTKNSAI